MKKYKFKVLSISLLATLAISSCSIQTREHNRRQPRHDRNNQDDHRGDRSRNNNNRSY